MCRQSLVVKKLRTQDVVKGEIASGSTAGNSLNFFGRRWLSLIILTALLLSLSVLEAREPQDEPLDISLYKGDERYIRVSGFLQNVDYTFSEETAVLRDREIVLMPVVDKDEKEKGFLSIHNDIWTLSLELPNGSIRAYEVHFSQETGAELILVTREESVRAGTEVVTRAGQTGHNWCMYAQSVGLNLGCVDLEGNPLGYYHIIYYREGDQITPFSLAWWADWKGSIVVCPVNEKSWSPITSAQCGFPPE